MEPEGSLPHSQVPATCPYPKPDQSNPCAPPHPHFLKIYRNIVFPSTPRSSKWSLFLRFPHQTPVCTSSLPYTCYIPAHLPLDLINRIIFGEEYRSLRPSLSSFLHSPLPRPSCSKYLPQLFSNTLSPRSSLNVSDQASR
jgi:hypothetical protein